MTGTSRNPPEQIQFIIDSWRRGMSHEQIATDCDLKFKSRSRTVGSVKYIISSYRDNPKYGAQPVAAPATVPSYARPTVASAAKTWDNNQYQGQQSTPTPKQTNPISHQVAVSNFTAGSSGSSSNPHVLDDADSQHRIAPPRPGTAYHGLGQQQQFNQQSSMNNTNKMPANHVYPQPPSSMSIANQMSTNHMYPPPASSMNDPVQTSDNFVYPSPPRPISPPAQMPTSYLPPPSPNAGPYSTANGMSPSNNEEPKKTQAIQYETERQWRQKALMKQATKVTGTHTHQMIDPQLLQMSAPPHITPQIYSQYQRNSGQGAVPQNSPPTSGGQIKQTSSGPKYTPQSGQYHLNNQRYQNGIHNPQSTVYSAQNDGPVTTLQKLSTQNNTRQVQGTGPSATQYSEYTHQPASAPNPAPQNGRYYTNSQQTQNVNRPTQAATYTQEVQRNPQHIQNAGPAPGAGQARNSTTYSPLIGHQQNMKTDRLPPSPNPLPNTNQPRRPQATSSPIIHNAGPGNLYSVNNGLPRHDNIPDFTFYRPSATGKHNMGESQKEVYGQPLNVTGWTIVSSPNVAPSNSEKYMFYKPYFPNAKTMADCFTGYATNADGGASTPIDLDDLLAFESDRPNLTPTAPVNSSHHRPAYQPRKISQNMRPSPLSQITPPQPHQYSNEASTAILPPPVSEFGYDYSSQSYRPMPAATSHSAAAKDLKSLPTVPQQHPRQPKVEHQLAASKPPKARHSRKKFAKVSEQPKPENALYGWEEIARQRRERSGYLYSWQIEAAIAAKKLAAEQEEAEKAQLTSPTSSVPSLSVSNSCSPTLSSSSSLPQPHGFTKRRVDDSPEDTHRDEKRLKSDEEKAAAEHAMISAELDEEQMRLVLESIAKDAEARKAEAEFAFGSLPEYDLPILETQYNPDETVDSWASIDPDNVKVLTTEEGAESRNTSPTVSASADIPPQVNESKKRKSNDLESFEDVQQGNEKRAKPIKEQDLSYELLGGFNEMEANNIKTEEDARWADEMKASDSTLDPGFAAAETAVPDLSTQINVSKKRKSDDLESFEDAEQGNGKRVKSNEEDRWTPEAEAELWDEVKTRSPSTPEPIVVAPKNAMPKEAHVEAACNSTYEPKVAEAEAEDEEGDEDENRMVDRMLEEHYPNTFGDQLDWEDHHHN